MPTDPEIIKELEKEIGIELTEKKKIAYSETYKGAYQKNSKNHVVRLALEQLKLVDFPHTILELKNLKYLSLYTNQLIALPPEINRLTNLTVLNFSSNQLSDLPPEITRLTNLTALSLSSNQLIALPPEITRLTNLTTLSLDSNQLIALPPEITRLTNLTTLDLDSNQLIALPPEITRLTNLITLRLLNNPIKQPPLEIATDENNIEKIRNYFEEIEAQGEDYIYEAKLILVGEPGAGKTSLAEKLLNPNYVLNPDEPMTEGIDVKRWTFPYAEAIPFRCNIWDFGGQEIMHATHRYFLTKRSLYIVVADNRKEDTDFYYWLNIVELLSGKSPTLIVLNEKFTYKKYVPETILKSFESVRKVFHVNLADNTELADLSRAIRQHLRDLPHVGKDPIPKIWVRIREALEAAESDYITRGEYLGICRDYGINDEKKAGYISEFLHDLGVILHFQKDRILRDTVIVNTRWATEAVYQVLFDNTVIGHGGAFDNDDLDRIWRQPHYQGKHGELLQLMLNFELCFEIDNHQRYIAPELLPEKPISDSDFWARKRAEEKGVLHFEHRYDFMPKGIISRLIVRMNRYIFERRHWKSGVVLQIGESRAEVVEHFNRRVLKIRVAGRDRLDALAIIRKEVKDLHDAFENLVCFEMVPCNCPECRKRETPHFFDYDELKQYKREGETHIKCRMEKIKNVGVLSLISDVFIKEETGMKEGAREKVHIEVNPNIKVEGSKTVVNTQASAHSDVDVVVAIDLKVDLPAIQDVFADLRESMVDADPGLEKSLDRLEDSLDAITPESDKKELAGPMNKMRRFLEKVGNEDSDLHKAIRGTKKGIEMAQKVGKTYNKFADWLALPHVPDLLLGKDGGA